MRKPRLLLLLGLLSFLGRPISGASETKVQVAITSPPQGTVIHETALMRIEGYAQLLREHALQQYDIMLIIDVSGSTGAPSGVDVNQNGVLDPAEDDGDRNPPADHAHEDAFVTVRDAFNAARRRLQDRRRRVQGQVKRHDAPPQGRVIRMFPEEGYGFIESADGREIYFHRNAVVNGGFDRLAVGAAVRFAETEGDKGAQASTVHANGKG